MKNRRSISTIGVARAVAEAAVHDAIVSVAVAIQLPQSTPQESPIESHHISTGGGATLEFLAGEELRGVAALNDK